MLNIPFIWKCIEAIQISLIFEQVAPSQFFASKNRVKISTSHFDCNRTAFLLCVYAVFPFPSLNNVFLDLSFFLFDSSASIDEWRGKISDSIRKSCIYTIASRGYLGRGMKYAYFRPFSVHVCVCYHVSMFPNGSLGWTYRIYSKMLYTQWFSFRYRRIRQY